MRGPEEIIFATVGILALLGTGLRVILHEFIAVVFLYKELRMAIKSDYPGPPQVTDIKRKPHTVSSGKFTNRLHP